ncbi:complement receptor type 1 isoform X2 [Carassius auratus]|uniref:Complement receptor type 1 isoform X2 n=1 Tax=Carassius auratus TaxID=7957 RepID=A0A6P6M7M2_CARAU|nr:complement receptor type 1-like isoform X2 [Carassius auratus]
MGCKVLCPSIVLLAYLMICEHVRGECTQPSFEARNVILSANDLSTQNFSEGSSVTFDCQIGHKPVDSTASRSVTCEGNQWTSLGLSCTRKPCGSLPDFLYGRYEMTGILFGDTAKPVCDQGYMLAGRETTRTCRNQGWDGRDPLCESVKCSAPPAIENGQLQDVPLESYEYLDAVSYRCNGGLTLIGQSTLHCSEDGTFKPDPPKCFDGCPAPKIPNAKRVGGKSAPYKQGNFIEYKCEDGYTLKGDAYIVCRGNGWSPEPPQCIGECTQPSFESRNVILSANDLSTQIFPDGSSVTFECVIGHMPVDSTASRSVTCEGNQWTSLGLSCTKKSCGILPDILNGRYEMTGISFGDTAKPVCDKGYVLAGRETRRTCRNQGWDGRDPLCELVKCSAPPVIEHGQLKDVPLESYDYLDAVSYSCNRGFTLIGQSTLHCSEDGTFKPDPPKCFDGCPAPKIPNAKRVGGKSPPYKQGNFIEYKCEDGYTLKGDAYIVCRGNGWSPEPPQCIGECTQPSFESRNVILSANDLSTQIFPDGSSVTFECVIGHMPVDSTASRSVTCEGNQWTSLGLSCTRKSCGSLPNFLYGRYEMTGISFGDTAKPVCDKGYVLAGRETRRTCRNQGWDGRDPLCELVKCSAPPVIEHGQLKDVPLESYDYLDAVSYSCNRGFTLIGQSTLHCSEDGTFKPDPPKCFDGCPAPKIPNAKRVGGKSPPYKQGNFIEYKCEDGYTLKGDAYIVCRGNGWSPEPPQCIGECTQPSFESRNVILSANDLSTQIFPDGSSVTFECVIGHMPVDSTASRSVTCEGNQWTSLGLSCTRKSCGSLPNFLYGRYEMTGISFGDTAKPVCDKGYVLAGREITRTCRNQGWDGRDPLCELVKCSAPPVIEHGQLKDVPLESYDYLDAVSYSCNRGFTLIGQSTLHCSEDGTFKPDPPKCFDGCPAPKIPNAKRVGGKSPPYKQGNFIEYKCEDGYTLKGDAYIVCRGNGWSPEPPQCIGECTQPSFESRNVILSANDLSTQIFPDGSSVTFECVIGHMPVDSTASRSVTCEGNQWTSLGLSCTKKSCGILPDILNGRYEMTGISFGDTAKPVCDKGYVLAGRETTRTCRDQGWDGRDPLCEVVKCSAPPVIEHGQLKDVPLESYDYLDAVSYSCNAGFTLIGQSTLHCSKDGTFKPDPPKCFGKSCGSLPDFRNGRYEMTGTLFGDTAKPVCDKGSCAILSCCLLTTIIRTTHLRSAIIRIPHLLTTTLDYRLLSLIVPSCIFVYLFSLKTVNLHLFPAFPSSHRHSMLVLTLQK